MLKITDENNIICLKFAINKYHPKAIWFDMLKGICKFKAWQLKQELNAYAIVYEECLLLNFLIVLVDSNGNCRLNISNEFLNCRYLLELTIGHLNEILDNNQELYVARCEIKMIKPLKYHNKKSKSRKKTRKRTGIPIGLRKEVFKRDNYTCQHCGAKKGDVKSDGQKVRLEVDHKMPVSKGGDDSLDNLQTLCFDCNRNKSNVIQ